MVQVKVFYLVFLAICPFHYMSHLEQKYSQIEYLLIIFNRKLHHQLYCPVWEERWDSAIYRICVALIKLGSSNIKFFFLKIKNKKNSGSNVFNHSRDNNISLSVGQYWLVGLPIWSRLKYCSSTIIRWIAMNIWTDVQDYQ